MSKYITDKRFFIILLMLILVVSLLFLVIIFWPQLTQGKTPENAIIPTATAMKIPSNFPEELHEYVDDGMMTNGLLVGSVILVVIILLGVLISIRNNEK